MKLVGEWCFKNTKASAHQALEHIAKCLHDHPRNNDVELVLAEAMGNIVDHGFDGEGTGRITIIQSKKGQVRCILNDQGRAFDPPNTPPDGIARLRGHGWIIIRALVRSVTYDRINGRNKLQLDF